jgi:hypothetical protein
VNEWELYDLQTDPQEQRIIRSTTSENGTDERKAIQIQDQYDDHEPTGELH